MTAAATDSVQVIAGDCLEVLPTLESGSVDAVVCDPPYELGFMGQAWDSTDITFRHETWAAVSRAVRPGGYMLAMGGSRTYHRMTCAIEDAGWEIRDCLMWLYGTGFPKSSGCLKPAHEPIILARKRGPKMLPLGVDACRVPTQPQRPGSTVPSSVGGRRGSMAGPAYDDTRGRYPANVLHSGDDEVMEAFGASGESGERMGSRGRPLRRKASIGYGGSGEGPDGVDYGDAGTAARFFYCAKASRAERNAGLEGMPKKVVGVWNHPTVKPLALMRWLVRLVCPAGGLILDPFAGSGTTGIAAMQEGRRAILIEREPAYLDIIRRRLANHEPIFAGAAS